MSERIVTKAGGTSNATAAAVEVSLGFAEEADIFVASAPGRLEGWSKSAEDNSPIGVVEESKVTDMLLRASEFAKLGEVPKELIDLVVGRYSEIVNNLGRMVSLRERWLDNIPTRMVEAAIYGEEYASVLGERLQAEIYEAAGFTWLDPSQSPQDLGANPDAWKSWLSEAFVQGQRYTLVGNMTKQGGRIHTFDRGGSDTSSGLGAYGIHADLNLNLTDGGAKSADPRILGENLVKHIGHLLYKEGRELGRNGTGLFHPDAMIPLMIAGIPTEIRSTFDPTAPYTVMDNDTDRAASRIGQVVALSLMKDVFVLKVEEPGMQGSLGKLATYEDAMADGGVVIIDAEGAGVDGHQYLVNEDKADIAYEALATIVGRKGEVTKRGPIDFITLVGYELIRRRLDVIDEVMRNFRGDHWQRRKLPLSAGADHSLRIGVDPAQTDDALRTMHKILIERDYS